MKYTNSSAFWRALEDRLRAWSLKTGSPLVRLCKMVAFDRLLARLIVVQADTLVLSLIYADGRHARHNAKNGS